MERLLFIHKIDTYDWFCGPLSQFNQKSLGSNFTQVFKYSTFNQF